MTTRDMLLRIVLTLIPAVLIYALVRLELTPEERDLILAVRREQRRRNALTDDEMVDWEDVRC
jgi:hypothetical protein